MSAYHFGVDVANVLSIMPQSTIDKFNNGCGPEWLPGWLFPDGPFESCQCCAKHDLLYAAGGTKVHFLEVEHIFRRDLLTAARAEKRMFWRLLWTLTALVYSAHTRVWGYHTSWRHDTDHLASKQLIELPKEQIISKRLSPLQKLRLNRRQTPFIVGGAVITASIGLGMAAIPTLGIIGGIITLLPLVMGMIWLLHPRAGYELPTWHTMITAKDMQWLPEPSWLMSIYDDVCQRWQQCKRTELDPRDILSRYSVEIVSKLGDRDGVLVPYVIDHDKHTIKVIREHAHNSRKWQYILLRILTHDERLTGRLLSLQSDHLTWLNFWKEYGLIDE